MAAPVQRRWVVAGAAALLAGCGFRPLYAPGGDAPSVAQAELAAIYVSLLPDRSGQLMRQALQQRFEGAGTGIAKRYECDVLLVLLPEATSIQRDNSTTRLRLIGTASWTLRDLSIERTVVANGTARSVDGYNVLNQQFFALEVENDAATRRITSALADQMTLQLSSFFASRAAAS